MSDYDIAAHVEPGDAPAALSDEMAERSVLSAFMNRPALFPDVLSRLTADQFWDTRHSLLFGLLADMEAAGRPIGLETVLAEAADRRLLDRFDQGAYLSTLFWFPFIGGPEGVSWSVGRVRSFARKRATKALADRMQQIADSPQSVDTIADQLAGANLEMQLLIEEPADTKPVEGLSMWADFIDEPMSDHNFVVPGLLDRQEVVMILAPPGAGKSWLSRQLSLMIASGIHPFTPSLPIPAKRTLLIDLENPEDTVRRQSQVPYATIARLSGEDIGDRGWIWRHPAGLNIRKRADAAYLERVVSETRPDLICIGSLYNLFERGSDDWDTAAEQTKAVLNRIRARYGCALWIEHHMPRSNDGHRMSPFGSTIWERWPSYGRVIDRITEHHFELRMTFRGDREAGREFPAGLKRGERGIPWEPIWTSGEIEQLRQGAGK